MPDIVVADGLTRTFRRPERTGGLRGALRHLVRPQWRTVTAVDDVTFRITPGESVAYIGPNGAGKSTTIKLLTGILVPSSGVARVCDVEPFRERQRNARNISVVFGQRTQLWWDIPVADSFRLLGDIYSVPAVVFRRTLDELVDVLDLGPLLDSPARQLSLGQRMRCDLAAALVHSPKVLFLDEPTIGLDVSVKARLREFIARMRQTRELTVLLTSHDLGDIEELCPRLMMIDKARLVYDGSFTEVTRQFGWRKVVRVTVSDDATDPLGVARSVLARLDPEVSGEAPVIEVAFDSRKVSPGEVIRELALALPVQDLSLVETSAEQIVRELYEGTLALAPEPTATKAADEH